GAVDGDEAEREGDLGRPEQRRVGAVQEPVRIAALLEWNRPPASDRPFRGLDRPLSRRTPALEGEGLEVRDRELPGARGPLRHVPGNARTDARRRKPEARELFQSLDPCGADGSDLLAGARLRPLAPVPGLALFRGQAGQAGCSAARHAGALRSGSGEPRATAPEAVPLTRRC